MTEVSYPVAAEPAPVVGTKPVDIASSHKSGQEMAKLLTQPSGNEPRQAIGNIHLHGAGAKKRARHQHCVGQLTQNIHKVKKVIVKTSFTESIEDRE